MDALVAPLLNAIATSNNSLIFLCPFSARACNIIFGYGCHLRIHPFLSQIFSIQGICEDLASLSRSAADWGKWYAEMHSFGTLIMIASSLLVLVEPYYFEATP
jgi:hypothetical protein